MAEKTRGLPVRSVRDPRHPTHQPPKTPRCPPGECVAHPFVALCPKCDWPVNVPRDEVIYPLLDRQGNAIGQEKVQEPWRLRRDDG